MSAFSSIHQPHTCLRSKYCLLMATVFAFTAAALAHAQSALPPAPAPSNTEQQVLPDIGPSSGFSGTTSGPQSNASPIPQTGSHIDSRTDSSSPHHQRSSAATPFKIPRTITKTTDSGVKFQFTLPRVGFSAGQRIGQISPLDSNGMQSMGARGTTPIFPSDNSFMQPTDTASDSDNMFGSTSNGMSGMSRGGHGSGGAGRGGGAGGPGLNVKSSIFDLHMGLSMKDMMGGSFSQNSGSSSTGASDFNSTGGLRTPGSEGRGAGAGAKLSLGLRF